LPKQNNFQQDEELHWHPAQLISLIKCKDVENVIRNLTGVNFDQQSTSSNFSSTQTWEIGWQRNESQIQGSSYPIELLSRTYWQGYDEIALLSFQSNSSNNNNNNTSSFDTQSHALTFANCNLIEVLHFVSLFISIFIFFVRLKILKPD
jgi:hypothetical protein